MKKLIFLAVFFIYGCDEMQTTQHGDFTLSFEGYQDGIPADGKSHVKLNLRFDNKLSKNELVTITTTSGHFVELPSDDMSVGVNKLEVYPDSKDYAVALVASNIPNDEVLVGVKVAKTYKEKQAKFNRICPTELSLDLDKETVSLGSSELVKAYVGLFNPSSSIMHDTWISLRVNPDSLAKIPSRLFFEGDSLSFEVQLKGRKGDLRITATIEEEDCEQLVQSASLKIVE